MPRILVVDDEPEFRELLRELLERSGYETAQAADSVTACSIAADFRPDLLIVDWVVKGAHAGVEIVKMISEVNPSTKTIVISGLSKEAICEQAAGLGIFAVLEKPFESAELKATVQAALKGAVSATDT
ncbi:MAG: response regulator [Bdellovibrionota bacterium]